MFEIFLISSSRSFLPRASRNVSSSTETSKWSSIAFLPRPVTRMMLSMPDATASSTPYWMIGLSTSGSISFGCALVAGRKRVPRPAAGKTALRIILFTFRSYPRTVRAIYDLQMLDAGFVREHMDDVKRGLQSRGMQPDADLDQFAALESRRRALIPEIEGLKREQNAAADEVARAKRQGQDPSSIFAANKARGQQI